MYVGGRVAVGPTGVNRTHLQGPGGQLNLIIDLIPLFPSLLVAKSSQLFVPKPSNIGLS